MVVDEAGAVVSIAQRPFKQIFPEPGWVEHSPTEIWASQSGVATEALAAADLTERDIAAIGITNQRETTVVWDRETGEPVYNAIVWQDRRTAAFCDALRERGDGDADSGEDRVAAGCLFLGQQGQLDFESCRRCEEAGGGWEAGIWDRR